MLGGEIPERKGFVIATEIGIVARFDVYRGRGLPVLPTYRATSKPSFLTRRVTCYLDTESLILGSHIQSGYYLRIDLLVNH
jgi:hypothetical protein